MSWVATALRALGHVLAALAAVAAGLQAAKVWNLTGKTLVVLVIGAALVTLVGQVAGLVNQVRGRRRETLAQDVRTYLFAMFIKVQEDAKLPAATIGFAAYELRRRWIWRWPTYRRGLGWRWRFPLPWRQVLVRLDRHRPAERQDTLRTVWTPGKGIIGLAVKRGQLTYADVSEVWSQYSNCTEQEWNGAPEDVRMGFTHSEFTRRMNRVGVVWALPVIRDRNGKTKVIGCVALDVKAGSGNKLLRPSAHTSRHLGDASASIANRLSR